MFIELPLALIFLAALIYLNYFTDKLHTSSNDTLGEEIQDLADDGVLNDSNK